MCFSILLLPQTNYITYLALHLKDNRWAFRSLKIPYATLLRQPFVLQKYVGFSLGPSRFQRTLKPWPLVPSPVTLRLVEIINGLFTSMDRSTDLSQSYDISKLMFIPDRTLSNLQFQLILSHDMSCQYVLILSAVCIFLKWSNTELI